MNDIIQMPKGDYIMKDAVYVDTGETRTDGWYPEWIGMTVPSNSCRLDCSIPICKR